MFDFFSLLLDGWICAKSCYGILVFGEPSNKLNLKYLVKMCCEWILWIYVSVFARRARARSYAFLVWFGYITYINAKKEKWRINNRSCQMRRISTKIGENKPHAVVSSGKKHIFTVRMIPFHLMQLNLIIGIRVRGDEDNKNKFPSNKIWAHKKKFTSFFFRNDGQYSTALLHSIKI